MSGNTEQLSLGESNRGIQTKLRVPTPKNTSLNPLLFSLWGECLKNIRERVLEALTEKPMTPDEIGEKLRLKFREFYGKKAYYWGKWNFKEAEELGLIEWKDGKWHRKKCPECEKPFEVVAYASDYMIVGCTEHREYDKMRNLQPLFHFKEGNQGNSARIDHAVNYDSQRMRMCSFYPFFGVLCLEIHNAECRC